MTTEVKIVMDVRYKKTNGKYPICLRYTHQRLPVYISLDFATLKECWNQEEGVLIDKSMTKTELTFWNKKFLGRYLEVDNINLHISHSLP